MCLASRALDACPFWDPIENPGNARGKYGFWVWGIWGVIFILNCLNCKKRVAQKLRMIIMFHFGLVAFKFHFLKPKPIIVMVFGPSECGHDPKNRYI